TVYQPILSYTHGASVVPLLGETIGEKLRKTAEKFPQHDALISVSQNYQMKYKQFWQQITLVAKSLICNEIEKGDRIGIISPNCFQWVILQYAIARIGAILVCINPRLLGNELEYLLNLSSVKMIIAINKIRDINYKQILNEIHIRCSHLKKILILEDDWNMLIKSGENISDEQLLTAEDGVQFDDPVNIQYTSGTTGPPKAVLLSHHNILNSAYFAAKRLGYTENDRVCIPVPFFHCFGMVHGNLACTLTGSCIVIPNEIFDAEKVLETVEQEKCTSLYGVPSMFIAEMEHPNFNKYDLSSLRTGIIGGSTFDIETVKQIQNKMNIKQITIGYGMTEASPGISHTFTNDDLERKITVGKALDHIEIKIIDLSTGKIVPRGETGELCTRGYHVMIGYYNNKEETEKVIDQTRWMHTGDLAIMDDQDYIRIVGRAKDMIIRGGENIYPKEIEQYLSKYPAIRDIQVIGVPSRMYGEEIMAWVQLKPDAQGITEKELMDYCKNNISSHKIPKYWKFVKDFPLTNMGKVHKAEMRKISIRELNIK
ncbi:unnamed protein product, partial [Didymodactylos carnosus]